MDDLIYDWNLESPPPKPPVVQLNDETLRDGLQSPSVRAPTIEQKLRILHLLDRIGIDTADIGLPGAGPHVVRDVERLAAEIVECRLKIQANCAARTVIADIQPIADIVQRTGSADRVLLLHRLESRSASYAEDWTVDYLQRCTEEASASRSAGPEDDVRHRRHDAIGSGHAAPPVHDGDQRRRLPHLHRRHGRSRDAGWRARGRALRETGRRGAAARDVGIDWHGHRDRDMGTINSLAALEAGRSRVHGTMLGIGERVGNTPMDLLMVNLVLMGWIERDLTHLNDLVQRGVGGDWRADSRQLSGVRPRRVPHGDRRSRRRRGQGVPQERSGARRHRVLGRAGASGRPLAADRGRSDVGQVERGVLARAPRHRLRTRRWSTASSAAPRRQRRCSPSRRSLREIGEVEK